MSHTPGPWRVGCWSGKCPKESHGTHHPGPRGSDPCEYVPYFYEVGGGIAGPEPGQMVVTSNYDGLEMSDDDARLIAAAPELLAALTELMACEPVFSEKAVIAGIRARAALTKATGV